MFLCKNCKHGLVQTFTVSKTYTQDTVICMKTGQEVIDRVVVPMVKCNRYELDVKESSEK